MGREIRRVPLGWEHPKDARGYVPMFDVTFEEAQAERKREGEGDLGEAERMYHRPKWDVPEEQLGYAVYEDVSEGTPVTPTFATKEELVVFLSTKKNYWGDGPYSREAAERFVRAGWVPSMVMSADAFGNTTLHSGIAMYEPGVLPPEKL